ncbi:DNA-binding transcriptional LysR family regulator [Humibacillus xanthopallidus]|uniref:DNA-binding transcriptional LysR family regulator n=1 Tax=Humibacillus xanthopallidus TaxID=412689 RepID=A0A543PQR9_9MICO|nr:LysR family transcriptional regulator [Humibacillus xanthopallidus]TQN46420.1 DNA-binding transcriptional LysR family regulator [Humibacillus xanthopallidus]
MDALDRLDWNLVPALNALLVERNVSRAARRLGISQPAASGALARLRRTFEDDLLVRGHNEYTLTPLAQRLLPLTRQAVAAARDVVGNARSFEAAASTREFVIVSTEYGQMLIGSVLGKAVARAAPHIRLKFLSPWTSTTPPSEWLSTVDGWLAPRDIFVDMPSTGLLPDRWVLVVADDNDRVDDDGLGVEDVGRLTWVVPTVPRDPHPWTRRLHAYGVDLKPSVVTQSFGSVPHLVAGSPHVGIVQERLAAPLARTLGLRVLALPWDMGALSLTLWWHPNREHDAAHCWLRQQVADSMAHVAAHGVATDR